MHRLGERTVVVAARPVCTNPDCDNRAALALIGIQATAGDVQGCHLRGIFLVPGNKMRRTSA